MICWPPFSRQRNKVIGAILAFAMAYLRGRYNGGAFTKTVTTQRCAPLSPSSFVTFDFAGLSSNLAYITSVFTSATSVLTRLVRLSNASLLKSRSRKMVEINNQRKAFLDMLAWSEGTDASENQKSWLRRHCRRRAIY